MTSRKRVAVIIVATAAIGAAALWSMTRPNELLVQGEVDATRIDLAARASGRVSDVLVDFGDRVKAGDILVQLDSPQLTAGLATSKAALGVAEANRDLAFSTRPETIRAREAELAKARADAEFAQTSFDRVARLQATSAVSVQSRDDASNKLGAALRGVEAAEANLELARNGNSPEQRDVAKAQVEQAKASVEQTETDIAELTVRSSIDGQITARMAEPGKNFAAGTPLMSVVDIDNAWFTFNLREDLLNGVKIGDILKVQVPSLGPDTMDAKVTAINALGSYANWRATKATGDFDLRTFSIRAVPTQKHETLRPGMSAIVRFGR